MPSALDIVQYIGPKRLGDCPRGLVGYFERRGQYSEIYVEKSISYFFDFFQDLHNLTLVSSLHIDKDLPLNKSYWGVSEEEWVECISPLCDLMWIRKVDYEKFGTNYDAPEYEKKVNALMYKEFYEFELFESRKPEVNLLFKSIMSIGGIFGFSYIVDCRIGLAVNPHEDTGFAVYSAGDAIGREAGIEFLRRVKINGFEVIIK